jgi:hypothetical protein
MPGELGDADETIKLRIQTEGKKTVEEVLILLKELQQRANAIKEISTQSSKAQTSASQQAKDAYDNEMKSRKEWADFLKQDQSQKREQTKERLAELQQQANAYKESGTKASGFAGILASLGTVGKYVFGTVLGLSAVQVLRKIGQELQQAIQYGYEFTKAVYQLSVGVNVLNRAGVDINIQDIYNNLDKLQKKFGVFSRKELVQGSAALINLIRDFGFAKDQIASLQDSIATLAVVNGRSMEEVQRTVALALSSGYTEGLQRLGVSINRVTIAMEAQRLGWGRNYMSLTEVQRAQATYNLILKKTAKYQTDLEAYQRTAPGRIDKAKVAWTDLATELGERVIPAVAALADAWGAVATAINDAIKANDEWKEKQGNAPGVGGRGRRYVSRYKMYEEQTSLATADDEEKAIKKQMQERLAQITKNDEILAGYALDLGNKLEDIQDDYTKTLNDNWEDYLDDKQQLTMDYIQKGLDIEKEYGEKLKDIQDAYAEDNADAWKDYYKDLADVNDWYNKEVSEASQKHKEDEIKAEEDFQRKMRDLRQQFLFDLEDAVRERDAKQAMLLIRQYNFDKQQAEQEKEDDAKDRATEYKQELADLKRQKAEKLANLKKELNERLAEISAEYSKELTELSTWKAAEYAEREAWYAKELALAQANWIIQNDKAAQARAEALKDLVKDMNKEYNLNVQQWKRLLELANDGTAAFEIIQQNYLKWLASAMAGVVNPSTLAPMTQVNWMGGMAKGGTITANKPTLALFGERGAERATFTPLSKGKGGIEGKVQIEVLLSPDLEARIIDSAVGEVANEFETVVSIRK